MRVAVMGNGHVGLVSCVSLAEMGHHVVGTDIDAVKMAELRAGVVHFYEPGVEPLLRRHLATERIRFTPDVEDAIDQADVAFVCVGTPAGPDGAADVSAVEAAARKVARYARCRIAIVQKSTVPVGTGARIDSMLGSEGLPGGEHVELVSNPEFLREGSALADSLRPTRIVVGAPSPWAFERMRAVYAPLVRAGGPYLESDVATAELVKLASNSFLALKVSFANALARICERAGGDVERVAEGLGLDPRIGPDFLRAGLGYGGYCLPKDVVALERAAAGFGVDFTLLREVTRLNDDALEAVVALVADAAGGLAAARVAVLGLAFKPGTDDVRSSPAIALVRRLQEEGARVVASDPRAVETARSELPTLDAIPDPYEAARDADCLVVATDWPEYRDLDLERLASTMARPAVVDARNLLDPDTVTAAGFGYRSVGRGAPASLVPAGAHARGGS